MDITVIVPVYKGQSYISPIQEMIRRNVKFAIRQGCPLEVELLFVNDYPNETIVIDDLKKDYEVVLITNDINSGIHQTRVNGLKSAKGKYVLFLDQDDKISNNCLYSQFTAIGDNDIVVGNGYKDSNGRCIKIYKSIKKQELSCKEFFFLRAANQIVSPGHCLIRKESIPSEWCDNIMTDNGSDDFLLWLLMFENKRTFCINRDCVFKHVDTGTNLSSHKEVMCKSSYNLFDLARKSGVLADKTLKLYKRQIDFYKTLSHRTIILKIAACLRNLDICVFKVYAHYR